MKIEAFRAFLSREGTTAALNTYDNQLVTWGVGFAGFGLLGEVMNALADAPPVVTFFHEVGLDYVSCSPYRTPIARLAAAQAALSRKT